KAGPAAVLETLLRVPEIGSRRRDSSIEYGTIRSALAPRAAYLGDGVHELRVRGAQSSSRRRGPTSRAQRRISVEEFSLGLSPPSFSPSSLPPRPRRRILRRAGGRW